MNPCFGLALLENEAQSLVIVVVLLLTFDIVIHDDVTVIAGNRAWLVANWTDREIWLNIFTNSNFVGHQVLIITRVRLSSEIHQELCYILCSSNCSEM